ncbi:hypothetical protein L218DRAFT_475628 [Marasmius fiardii PR-910]|nr:hypothetical protein L218DRAFT_475628 [Marasmius fiardii PR-910]
MTSLKSQSMTEVTLTTVDGHALKRRRVDYPIQRFKSEATLNSSSTSTSAATVLPSAPLPSVPKPPSRATPSPSPSPPKRLECTPTSSSLSLARRSPSPVPTELDIDNAERPDIDAYLFNTHKVKVIDYASNPPTTNFPRETGSDYSSTSPSRIPEAFFAKDAMAQYEWFMARGSREWDHLSQQGTEVWEDDDDNKEKTQTEAEIRQQRQQIQTTSENSKSPAQSSPRRGQPLRRQQRVPLTGIKLFNDDPATQPSSTPPASSAKPVVSEQEKTPLLPSFTPHNPLALRTSKPKRTYPIPGRILYRLHEIQWVSDEEARQRWLTCDWEEYHAYERQEREKFKDGKRGLMCRGEVGYPYWVVWGSPPSPQGSKKGKEKERAPEPAPQPTPELEPESHPEAVDAPEEEVIESQNVHATLSGTLDTPRTSPEPGAKDETPGSPSPPVEESQSMHPTLSGTIKTPHNTPSPPPVKTPSTTASPLSASSAIVTPANVPSPKPLTSPRKVTNAALAAQLYYLALAQDAELGYGKPPTRDYRRALGERAADVWMWLGEYTRRWGRLAGLGKKEKEVKDNVNNEQPLVIQGVVGGISDDDSGSGRVLGTNAGGLGRTRTLGGLGRTTTLRDLGRAGTLDANAFREVFVSAQFFVLLCERGWTD